MPLITRGIAQEGYANMKLFTNLYRTENKTLKQLTTMKKTTLMLAILGGLCFTQGVRAQLVDEQNVTITMDLQPILQLDMNGPQNIDFIFDDVSDYVGGITKYGVTQLKVSSTVAWDLYAVGFSSSGTNWDNQVIYGVGSDPNAVTTIPCTALELRQDKVNPNPNPAPALFADYNGAFLTSPVTSGQNNIFVSATPYTRPAATEKYIAGGTTSAEFVAGGSYLVTQGGNVGAGSNYWYTIDYRIVPGLPAVFPNAALNNGTSNALVAPQYAQPGVYTMNVKYVLVENEL